MKAPGQRTSGFHISDILDMPEGRGSGGTEGVAPPPPPPPSTNVPPHLTSYADRPLTLHAPWQIHPDHHGKLFFLNKNSIT